MGLIERRKRGAHRDGRGKDKERVEREWEWWVQVTSIQSGGGRERGKREKYLGTGSTDRKERVKVTKSRT